MVRRRAARFCHNDYKTIEKGCMPETMGILNLEPLNIRRTKRRLTILHKAINGHLALPIGHLQSVLRRTRHLNSKAYNTIHTSNDSYKYSFFPRTTKHWNLLPEKLAIYLHIERSMVRMFIVIFVLFCRIFKLVGKKALHKIREGRQ